MNNINKEIKKILTQKYNIETVKIEKNKESTDGNVFIIYGKHKKYVAKIYDDIIHTKRMVNLHLLLDEKKINAPKIIKNIDGNYYYKIIDKNIYLVIYSFIEGKKIEYFYKDKGKLNENLVKRIARNLRKLHNIVIENEIKLPNKEKSKSYKNILNLPQIPFMIEENTNRYSILHFDLTKSNIIIDKNKINFIDFDDSKYGESVCDIAIIISFLFLSKTNGIDLNNIKLFLKEYYKNNKLQSMESPLIKEYGLKWINYLLNEKKFNTSLTESFEEKRILIRKYL